MRRGTVFQLPPLAPLTDEIGFGLLPTPTVVDSGITGCLEKTQRRREAQKAKGVNGNGFGYSLGEWARLWPTPTARLGNLRGMPSKEHVQRRRDSGRTINLEEVVIERQAERITGALNPTWVEWLMGFPSEWTALKPSETPSCLKLSKSSAKQS